nr:hypothetical protein [uncultured bacterium]
MVCLHLRYLQLCWPTSSIRLQVFQFFTFSKNEHKENIYGCATTSQLSTHNL